MREKNFTLCSANKLPGILLLIAFALSSLINIYANEPTIARYERLTNDEIATSVSIKN